MNKYFKLVKNSSVFALANMGSSLISFLLVRFYTELLTAEEFGTIDFISTTASILVPLLTMAIVEAVLRFSMDSDHKESVLNNGIFVVLMGNLLFLLVGPIVLQYSTYARYFKWMELLILATSLGGVLAQYIRGRGQVAIFALYGIVKTAVLVSSNLLLLAVFHFKINGYLCSMVLSEFAGVLFLIGKGKLWKVIRIQIDKPLFKQMVCYALPLVPNSLSWWVMNASDKYMIVAFMGLSANGIYAVAHKIPSLINLCNGLFFQAWQLSAVEESNKQDTDAFYSRIFDMMSGGLAVIASCIFLFEKLILQILVAASYENVWRYTPFLVLSMMFSAFSSFLGVNYVAMKKTNGALKTAILGAVANLGMNYVFIPRYGLNGAAFATMLSFLIMWISRAIDTRKFVIIQYRYKKLIPTIILLLVQASSIASDWKHMMVWNKACTILILLLYVRDISAIGKRMYQVVRIRWDLNKS